MSDHRDIDADPHYWGGWIPTTIGDGIVMPGDGGTSMGPGGHEGSLLTPGGMVDIDLPTCVIEGNANIHATWDKFQ